MNDITQSTHALPACSAELFGGGEGTMWDRGAPLSIIKQYIEQQETPD